MPQFVADSGQFSAALQGTSRMGVSHPMGLWHVAGVGNGSAALTDHLVGHGRRSASSQPTGVPDCHYTFVVRTQALRC